MITIIIPTAGRPDMLRTALKSVAAQTALDQVDRVFVSENGGSRESEKVCVEFSTLPITYLYRTPMPPLEHGKALIRECLEGEIIAFLHDDDWWLPTHLANGLQALATHSQAMAYCGTYFTVSGESSMLNCIGTLFPWFGSNYAPFKPVWELSRLNVLMAQLLGTITHYSTMMIRTEAMKKASYVYELDNPYDNDRMLVFALSTFGTLLYNPLPQVFVRYHSNQDGARYRDEAKRQHMCNTTRWMVERSGKSWDVIANSFYQRMALCPCEAYSMLLRLSFEEWCVPELARNSSASLNRLKRREAAVPVAA